MSTEHDRKIEIDLSQTRLILNALYIARELTLRESPTWLHEMYINTIIYLEKQINESTNTPLQSNGED